jgi:putative multiple sugar transport system permease protein
VTCLCIGIAGAIVFLMMMIRHIHVQKKLEIIESVPKHIITTIVISLLILWFSFKLACYRGFPMVLIWIALVLGIYAYITTKTAIGRHLYAVGGNEKATALSGVKTRNVYWFAYANIGLLAGLAGILTAGRAKGIDPVYGEGYEMDAIASCFIGGASAYGGSGKVSGMIIGALLMGIINKGMIIIGVDANYQKVVKGIVLLAAVMFDVLSKRQKR